MLIYFPYSDIYQTKMAAKMILHQNQNFKKQACLLNTRNRCFYFAHSLQFFSKSPYFLILLRYACTKVASVPGSHVRPVNMTKFLNNIPSLRGIVNCTSVTFLWRFRNGWIAPVKQEDERKLTETECNKTPWGQHAHQLIKHMEQMATSDTHVSQRDQRNNALSGQNGSRTCPPYCGWNLTAHSFSCVLANYEFMTTISNIYMWTMTKLCCMAVMLMKIYGPF